MATRHAEVDAVLIGVGLVGTMLGRELTRAGLNDCLMRPRDRVRKSDTVGSASDWRLGRHGLQHEAACAIARRGGVNQRDASEHG
jgi:hypothetical protein